MRAVIITGLSGAGKSKTIRCLEDMGFYCVDNMPPVLASKFIEMCYQSQGKLSRVALVVDVRSREMFSELVTELTELDRKGYQHEVLFLEASDEVLIKRYKETRRTHPLTPNGRVKDGISLERRLLSDAKGEADYILDTTDMKPEDLKANIKSLFADDCTADSMVINIISFGFKYGIPLDSDLVFDVRFLPNPFYVNELKEKTGKNTKVKKFVMQYPQSEEFCKRLVDMVKFLIPMYIEEGKGNLIISIGCTGGKHRSVVVARELFEAISKENSNCVINHRDIGKK